MLNLNIPLTSNTQSISNLVFYTDTVTDSIGDFFTLVLTNSTTQKTQIVNFDPSYANIISRNTRFIELRLSIFGPDSVPSPEAGTINLAAPAGNWTYTLWQSSAMLLCLDPACSYEFNSPEEWLAYRQTWSGGITSAQRDEGQAFVIENNPDFREIVFTPYTQGNEDFESIVYVQPGVGITAGAIYGGGRIYDIQGGTAYVVALSDLGTFPFGCAPTVVDFTGDVTDRDRTESMAEACPYTGTAAVAAIESNFNGLNDWALGSTADFARIVANGYGTSVGLTPGTEYWTNQDYPYNGQTNNMRRSYQLNNTTYWTRPNGRTNLIPNENTWTVPSNITRGDTTDPVPSTPITTVEGFTKNTNANLVLQSQTLETTWLQENVSVTANAATGPDGTATADYVVGTTGGNVRLRQEIFTGVEVGNPYVVSAYVQAGSFAPALSVTSAGFSDGVTAYFNLFTGTYTGFTGGLNQILLVGTPQIQSVGSGWFRISFVFTTNILNVSIRLYSSNGVLNSIPESGVNLAFHSQTWASGNNWVFFDTTTATGTTGTLDPLGTNTANAISPTGVTGAHYLISNNPTSVSYTSGTIYTQSAFFKQGTGAAGRYVQLSFPSTRFTQLGYANFDLQTGSVVASGGSPDTNRAASIENYGNGWYRCRLTATCNTSGTGAGVIPVLITASGDTRVPSFAGVTGDILYGWGAQLEVGSTATAYIPTTTTSRPGWANWWGIQLEPATVPAPCSVTNLALQSQDFNVSGTWTLVTGGTGVIPVVTPNAAIAPDGTQSADNIVLNVGSGTLSSDFSIIRQNITVSAVAYTYSIWLKSNTGTNQFVSLRFNSAPLQEITITNDWQRFTFTGTPDSGSRDFGLDLRGNNTSGQKICNILAWGAQVQAGSTATAYIPTTNVPLTSYAACAAGTTQVLTSPSTYVPTTNIVGGAQTYLQQQLISGTPGASLYTVSRFFKSASPGFTWQTSLEYNLATDFGTAWRQDVNINGDGTVTLGTSTLCTGTVTNFGSGWYRVTVTFVTGTVSTSNGQVLLKVPPTTPPNITFLTAGGMFEAAGEVSPWVDSGLVSTYNAIVTPDGTDSYYTNFTSSLAGLDSATILGATAANWNTLGVRQAVGSLPLSTNTPLVVLAKKPAGSSLNYLKVELNNSVDGTMWIVVDLRDGTHTVAAQSQTNSLLQSQNFISATWAKSRVNVRSSAVLAPGGGLADYIVISSNGGGRLYQDVNFSPGTQAWYSCWVKQGNVNFCSYLISNSAETVLSSGQYNFDTGTFSGTLGSYVTQRNAVTYANGWVRLNMRITVPAGQSTVRPNILPGDFQSVVTGNFCYLWGASLTQTTSATPPDYIQTTTAALTRSGYTHNVLRSTNGYYWIVLRRTSTTNATMNAIITPMFTPDGDTIISGNPADKIIIGGVGLSVIPQVPFPNTFDFPATYPAGAWDGIARDDLDLHLFPKGTNLPVRLFREFTI